jgi:hypothetical protein
MAELILAIVIVLICVTCARMVCDFKSLRRHVGESPVNKSISSEDFRCKAEVVEVESDEGPVAAFNVKIRGRVDVPTDMHDTDVQVLLADVTEDNTRAVLCSVRQWQMEDSPAFCFISHNGKIRQQACTLSDWVQIAMVRSDYLKFPRQGRRKLEFVISVISHEGGGELACADCIIEYENSQVGYIDAMESNEQSETLSLQLAVALALRCGGPNETTEAVISRWADRRVERVTNSAEKETMKGRLKTAMQKAINNSGIEDKSAIDRLCRELSAHCAIMERYGAMKLCLEVVGIRGAASNEITALLSHIADLLDVDKEKFRSMVQKLLPLSTQEASNVEFILGITPDMSAETTRQQLNQEYQKWNARVTHPDPAIQAQADQMLQLIAEARSKYVEQTSSSGA